MRKYIGAVLFFSACIFLQAEVEVKIIQPLKFDTVNTTHLNKSKAIGVGIIEVRTDNKEEDIGSKVVFEFPSYGMMTNRRKWVKLERLGVEKKEGNKERELIITQEVEHIKFYAILDRREINRDGTPKELEGEYIGYIPIIASHYQKAGEKISQGGESK